MVANSDEVNNPDKTDNADKVENVDEVEDSPNEGFTALLPSRIGIVELDIF